MNIIRQNVVIAHKPDNVCCIFLFAKCLLCVHYLGNCLLNQSNYELNLSKFTIPLSVKKIVFNEEIVTLIDVEILCTTLGPNFGFQLCLKS